MNNSFITLLCCMILSAGIFAAGLSIGKAVYLARVLNRSVTVKGLAERDVAADLGIWDINYRVIGNDLVNLNQQILTYQNQVTDFLQKHHFTAAELEIQPIKVDDKLANTYQSDSQQNINQRYVVTGGIRIRSKQVQLIQKTSQALTELLQLGVPLAFDLYAANPNPAFYFTQLDTIRPEMLAHATQSARQVAEQFATDSHTKLAGIQSANQGVFQIMSRDSSSLNSDNTQNAISAIDKKVRLVTTIEYRLK